MTLEMGLTLLVTLWTACGVLTFGRTVASFQWEPEWMYMAYANRRRDVTFAVLVSLFGPMGLLVATFMGRNGVRWTLPTREQSQAHAQREFAVLMLNAEWRREHGFSPKAVSK